MFEVAKENDINSRLPSLEEGNKLTAGAEEEHSSIKCDLESNLQGLHMSCGARSDGFYLPDDVCGEIFSFFAEDIAITTLMLISKRTKYIIQNLALMKLKICRYQINDWGAVHLFVENIHRISFLDISSSNCKSSSLLEILQSVKRRNLLTTELNHAVRPTTISIAKCLSVTEELLYNIDALDRVALCDIFITKPIPTQFFKSLKTLIFTNNTFSTGSLRPLFDNFPPSLTFLALGGCEGVVFSSHHNDIPCNIVNTGLRDNLFIEVTFLETPDKDFIKAIFPQATLLDIWIDSVDSLQSIFSKIEMGESGLQRALFSCSNSLNSTPLHQACRAGDFARCDFILRRNGRTDLKDCKGCLPLHRAVEGTSYHRLPTTPPPSADSKNSAPEGSSGALAVTEPTCASQSDFNSLKCVLMCLEESAGSCFVKNQNGETPLYLSSLRGIESILFNMIRYLQRGFSESQDRRGDYLGIDEMCCDNRGYSPLHAAVLCKSLPCVQLLLMAGCSPNKQNTLGSTPLHLGYRSGVEDIIATLLKEGGKEDMQDYNGLTPKQYSVESKGRQIERSSRTTKKHAMFHPYHKKKK